MLFVVKKGKLKKKKKRKKERQTVQEVWSGSVFFSPMQPEVAGAGRR